MKNTKKSGLQVKTNVKSGYGCNHNVKVLVA
jgi:hypothetical protein